ncbi:hypothetical protein ONS96_010751 [Cadophora gregata f. sp. sojae]|nr:hypothetical protein ONS96_010751 [Cadophora gregata f. sp. sojae]
MSSNEEPEALPVAATSFPQLSFLPAEIREVIWQAAAFPRIVYLEVIKEPEHYCSRVWSQTSIGDPHSMAFFDLDHQSKDARGSAAPIMSGFGLQSRSVPELFYVCVESHKIARTIYTKCFGTKTHPPNT